MYSSIKQLRSNKRSYSEQNEEEHSECYIDDEFQAIIENKCPGRLKKLLNFRFKNRVNTEQSFTCMPENPKNLRVFQKTIFQQKQKSKEKQLRLQETKNSLQRKIYLPKQKPYIFFEPNRLKMCALEKKAVEKYHSVQGDQHNSIRSMAKQARRKKMHPYVYIVQKMEEEVCLKNRDNPFEGDYCSDD